MEKLPDTLAIALWITGSSWALALVACLFGASTEWLLPLFMFGLLTGVAEWILRRMQDGE
jgi:ABC-type phosphate/phosphonate transport system permease subunit